MFTAEFEYDPNDPADTVMLRRADGHVDYWEGER